MTASQTQFQFTRHLPSCNNIDAGKLFGKDFEPSGTFFGIKKAIGYAKEHRHRFISNNVCVSNLLRTWITAALLYGTGTKPPTTLYLHVYPHLKEKVKKIFGLTIKRGNYPKSIDHTISKFKLFLDTLMKMKFLDGFPEFELSEIIELIIPHTTFKFTFVYETAYEVSIQPTNLYNHPPLKSLRCKGQEIYDTIGPTTNLAGYKTDGDLEKFMQYYIENNEGPTNHNHVVHVVTHSATMQSYLNSIKSFVREYNYEDVIHTNLWSFRTVPNNDAQITLMKGVELDTRGAIKLEKENVAYSLCGYKGSVKKNECNSSGGTRRQRRLTNKLNKTYKKKKVKQTRRWGKRSASY